MNLSLKDAPSIRKWVKEKRDCLEDREVDELSRTACLRLESWVFAQSLKKKIKTIALFSAIQNELSPYPFQKKFLESYDYAYPRIGSWQKKELQMYIVDGLPGETQNWSCSKQGILEPSEKCHRLSPGVLDMIVVPGVGFTKKGERIGMGAGFYDRYLPHATHALKVGFCYDFQIFDELPVKEHDHEVDWIITPKQVIEVSN